MLAIIGGSGLYHLEEIEIMDHVSVETPYGPPSAKIVKGKYGKQELLFLPRHGTNHSILPHEINYRANIWALKYFGARRIISVSAVGSLREEIVPGDFAIISGYFDFIKGNREKSFLGERLVGHVAMAEPTCSTLNHHIIQIASKLPHKLHSNDISYACVDGPRFGTKTESHFLRNAANCDLVGMTNIPESFLAREAAICYSAIAIATDYDCWRDNPDDHVNVSDVMQRYAKSIVNIKELLQKIFSEDLPERNCDCKNAIQHAILTPLENLPKEKKRLLNFLQK